jgi:plasmid replication initiation protein
VVWETVSLLSNTDFESIRGDTITKRIYIRDFLQRIQGDEKNYKYIIDAARALRFWEIASVNEQGQAIYRGFFNDIIHDKKTGYIDLKISKDWARELLDIAHTGNVSFLKQYLHNLQNSHAINLYPTLQAHCYKEKYIDTLENFKIKFGYNTSGYQKYSNLKTYVIDPAVEELNKNSDLIVQFEPTGINLDGKRPRVTGVVFRVKEKPKDKQIDKLNDEISNIENSIMDIPFVEIPKALAPKQESLQDIAPQQINSYQPSVAMIQELGVTALLTPEQCNEILEYFDNDYVKTWESIKGFAEIKDKGQQIARPLAYIFKSKGLGAGSWEKQQEKVRVIKDKQTAELIKSIQESYRKRRDELLEEMYNQASDEQKRLAFEIIKDAPKNMMNGRNIALDLKGKLNTFGVLQAGSMFAEAQGKGVGYRQPKYINHILEKHNIQIRFDHNDEVVYLNNVE